MSSKLEGLKIKECPAALVDFARKHNRVVDLLCSAEGGGGVSVVVAENNLKISADLATIVAAVIAALAGADVTFNSVTTTGGPNNFAGDTFVDYLESAGDVFASGTVYGGDLDITVGADIGDELRVGGIVVDNDVHIGGTLVLGGNDIGFQSVGTCDPGGTLDFLVVV